MKLLIITQKMDRNDPVLGFFENWVREFSKKFEFITVICLQKGEYDLPTHTKALSLGKEKKQSRVHYMWNFYKYIWQERENYDAVFVHMNQEYVLIGWKIWWLLGKKIYMWRNHHAGNLLTDISAFFCSKVFCTSKFSYTAKYKKTVLMPVGIDTHIFKTDQNISRIPGSILFLGRIAPSKNPDVLLKALKILGEKGISFSTSFYGDPSEEDRDYYSSLQKKAEEYGILGNVSWKKAVANSETPAIYGSHEIFVNLSPSGMYDKTIFEAMGCGCKVVASNENLRGEIPEKFIFKEGDAVELAGKLQALFSSEEGNGIFEELVAKNSLHALSQKLSEEIEK